MTRWGARRWGAFGASVVVHGAALATTLGHASTLPSEPIGPPATVAVDLVPVPPLDPATPDPHPERVSGTPSPTARKHPDPGPASQEWTPHDASLVHAFTATSEPASSAVAASEASALAAEALPRFTIAIGAGAGPAAPGPASNSADGRDREGRGIDSEQSLSTPARLVRGVVPRYPSGARAQGVEADVPLEVVVSANGAVESARPLGHAAYGFDESALEAIRLYRFEPAIRGGHAVRVRMRWTMEFRLR